MRPVLGRVLAGRYRSEQLLGSGGMAAVWRGRDLRLDRPVAIKVLTGSGLTGPTALARFDREARTAARLAHPNVVAVYDSGTDDGDPYLVMELVAGRNVSAMLADGPLPLAAAVSIAAQVCDGLAAAHEAGIVHRDIKPSNLILTPTGVVKICDFGIARLPYAGQNTLTGARTLLGTTGYMAPEQITGAPVDARADLYSLGCTLYALLTGSPPFAGEPARVIHQHVNELPAPLHHHRTDVPADLDALVGDLLAKDPAHRPADAGQVRARLATVPGGDLTAPDLDRANLAAVAAGAGAVASGAPAGPDPTGLAVPPAADLAEPGEREPAEQTRRYPGGGAAARRRRPSAVAAAVVGALIGAGVAVALLDRDSPDSGAAPPSPAVTSPSAGPSGGPSGPPPVPATAMSQTPASPPGRATTASPSAAPSSAPASATPSAGTSATPVDPITGMRSDITRLLAFGQLRPDAAKDLRTRLDTVERQIAQGDAGAARGSLKKLRDKLDDLYRGRKLSGLGYSTLVTDVDLIQAALPVGRDT
jgi:serine/threonine-protein kinase